MKFLFVAFLCTFAAVQGRIAFGEFAAVPGENPYLVHIRVAASGNNGLLSSCVGSLVGSLVGPSWVLTSASCVRNSRFMWLRFGAVDVSRPELVTEGNLAARVNGDLALLNINRVIVESDNIRRVVLADAQAEVPASGKFCGFGVENDAPGNQLSCANVTLEASENGILAVTAASSSDLGAPLVSDGVQVGVLAAVGDSSVFASVASKRAWIYEVTGL